MSNGNEPVIRTCTGANLADILAIINEAAEAYRGLIPSDCFTEPYMTAEELEHEVDAGVLFFRYEQGGKVLGVIGLQDVGEVSLIRHAYVRAAHQREGIGGALLAHLRAHTGRLLLVGTWAAATWAVTFYEHHGFRLVSDGEKDRLLRKYWTIPARQREASVVLADALFLEPLRPAGP
jgi:GNAT superfamily N-acetyltransferase